MKNICSRLILTIFLTLLLQGIIFSQACFIQLSDATGIEYTQEQLDSLEAAAYELQGSIPLEYQDSFKIYLAGYYLHNKNMLNGRSLATTEFIEIASSITKYYFIIINEVIDDGHSQLTFNLKLPNISSSCGNFSDIGYNLNLIIKSINSNNNSDLFKEISSVIKGLENTIQQWSCCVGFIASQNRISNRRLTYCVNEEIIDYIEYTLVNDSIWGYYYQLVSSLQSFYYDCVGNYKPYSKNGFMPACFIENGDDYTIVPYLFLDMAFISGFYDGLYQTIMATDDLVYTIKNIETYISLVVRSYLFYYIYCYNYNYSTTFNRPPNYTELKCGIEQALDNPNLTYPNDSLTYYLNEALEEGIYWESESEDEICKKSKAVVDHASYIVNFATNKDSIISLFFNIMGYLKDYFSLIHGANAAARYEQGKVVFEVLMLIVFPESGVIKYKNPFKFTINLLDNVQVNKRAIITSVNYRFATKKYFTKVINKINVHPKYRKVFETDFRHDYRALNLFDNKPGAVKAWEKFLDDGLPPMFRKNVVNLKQRTILDEWADNISSATNKQKGNFGEIGADLDLNAKGYTSLQTRINDINATGHNGIDIVVEKDGQYFIVEGKYSGSAKLNPANPETGLPRQMSDEWIATRDWSSVNLEQSVIDEIINNLNYHRILAKVKPDDTVIYRLVDSDGYEILGNAGVWTP